MRNKEGKSAVMILTLKGKMLLEILQGSCVHVIVRARNPLGAVLRSQGKLLTFCKAKPRLLHPVRHRQARVLLMTYVLRPPPRLVVEYPPGQRTYPNIPRLHRPGIVPGFTIEMERNYYKQDVDLREARKESL